MPQLGESVAEGTIGKWLKQPGDHVAKYEPLLEVITDKVNAEVPSPVEGVLKEILVEEGATVPNNAEIAVIEEVGAAGEAETEPAKEPVRETAQGPAGSDERPERGSEGPAASSPAAAASSPAAAASSPAAAASSSVAAPGPTASAPTTGAPAATAPGGNGRGVTPAEPTQPGDADARMTPAVRRLLREHGLTAAQIVGTGGGGRITREDVL